MRQLTTSSENGFTRLSIADKPLVDTTMEWVHDVISIYKPNVIEMSQSQLERLSPKIDGKLWNTIDGVPIEVTATSFFGLDVI